MAAADDELPTPVLDRAAGALVGLAVGDALGAGYEFGVAPAGDASMIGGGLGAWAPGEWTDDTQMAICIAEAAATGALDATAVAQRFLDWYATDPKDVGNQTRDVLGTAASATDVGARAAERYSRLPESSAGNGSLMRTAPVALAHLGDDDAIVGAAVEISALTHADPVAGEACALWCVGIDRAVREARIDGVWEGVDLLPEGARSRWAGWLHEAEDKPPGAFGANGYVVTALQAAWSAIRHAPAASEPRCLQLQQALHAAVRVGHDTDTVAAIAGSLLGARWGTTAVPLRWRVLLHGWPGYDARDLIRLAVMTARRGAPDELGWPAAPDVTPWYVENYDFEPFVTPLPDDPGVLLGNCMSATSAEADVVLSLCRMGTARSPGAGEVHELIVVDSPRSEHNPNLDFTLDDTADAIVAWRDEGKTVFVHCAAGVSRTSVVAAAYLARRLGISGTEALERVRAAHDGADPNEGFVAALDRF
jgi:ADP-ribosyl-[dinitrogen reductase] hydrolase